MGTVLSVERVSDLKGLSGTAPSDVAIASGYWKPGDGGGGIFSWDATSLQNDDLYFDAIAVRPFAIMPGQPGRWVRLGNSALLQPGSSPDARVVGTFSVKWFGALGDGTTDDTDRIQSAMDRAAVEFTPAQGSPSLSARSPSDQPPRRRPCRCRSSMPSPLTRTPRTPPSSTRRS